MKVELSFAELHTSLFLGGTNWGLKLYKKQPKGELLLAYDRQAKELLIKHKKDIAIVPSSNVASMTPMPESLEEVNEEHGKAPNPLVPAKAKPGPKPNLSAQVGSPSDHVFQGPGAGKTVS